MWPLPVPSWVLKVLAVGALVVALAGTGWYAKSVLDERNQLRIDIATQKAAIEDYQSRAREVFRLSEARAESAERIRTVTKEIIREVRIRIPADACPLPGDWRVLHDAAAQGIHPAPASGPDAAPVAPQDAADTVIENYGEYRDLADRLLKLQQYVKDQLK